MDRYVANPFTLFALLLFTGLALVILPLFLLGVIGGAFANLGFSWGAAFLILLATLAGSFINIPVAGFENQLPVYEDEFLPFVQVIYRIPSPRSGPPLPSTRGVPSSRWSSHSTSSAVR